VVNGDLPRLEPYLRNLPRVIRYGRGEHCDLRLTAYQARGAAGCRFEVNRRVWFDLPTPGEHMAMNALAAVALGRHFSLTDEQIAAGLATMTNEPQRLHTRTLGDGERVIQLIDDAYNANPESTAAALAVLGETAPPDARRGRRIAILGDMLELGEHTAAAHRELADVIATSNVDIVLLIGAATAHTGTALGEIHPDLPVAHWPTWTDGLPDQIAGRVQPGDVVLLKASRGSRLERLIPALESRADSADRAATHVRRGKE